ncbi:polysaccharide deacetylase family protein [Aquimarina agarivorans]|uniref:polysaccharide deacetylase family protein n=1 Tax=Aquimarina agarivorans TaxID=980584 RepID=UPI000248EB9E|nr:polysaccharide deacetylase family protein [Aquimarina agarivorans]
MLLIYTQKRSPRLRYIAKQLFERILGVSVDFTTKIENFVAHNGPKFSYGKQPLGKELFFQSVSLLFEKGISEEIVTVKKWDNFVCFYTVSHAESALPFDVFAASFYLLSRYEEYLPQVKDSLVRFMASSSIAYEHQFLQQPIVDIWAYKVKEILMTRFEGIQFFPTKFSTAIVCEVSEALAYRKKGWFRSFQSFSKSLFELKFKQIYIQGKVILGLQKDPYHTYNYIINKAKSGNAQLCFFFGLGNYSNYEKSNNHHSQTYQKLIKSIADYCTIGMRLSFDAQKDLVALKNEKKRFEKITHRSLNQTFCQYSKINLPTTYRDLIEQEVACDYSMGYQDNSGFRAGTCTPFLFYDLEYEIQTPLILMPYCLSENAFEKITESENAIKQASVIVDAVKKVNGNLIIHINNQLFDTSNQRSRFWKLVFNYFVSIS